MKNFIASIAAVMLATFAITPAFAEGRTVYTGVYGGLNWDDAISSSYVDNKQGEVVGAVLGTNVPAVPNLRVELDASYRTNDLDLFGGCLQGTHDTVAVMGNAIYDFPIEVVGGRPYALAGLGVAKTEVTLNSEPTLSNTDVAYQLGTGMNWNVAEGVQAGVGYRYFAGPELNAFGTQLSDGTDHSAVATVTFSLN